MFLSKLSGFALPTLHIAPRPPRTLWPHSRLAVWMERRPLWKGTSVCGDVVKSFGRHGGLELQMVKIYRSLNPCGEYRKLRAASKFPFWSTAPFRLSEILSYGHLPSFIS
jgi:hypothetical protein